MIFPRRCLPEHAFCDATCHLVRVPTKITVAGMDLRGCLQLGAPVISLEVPQVCVDTHKAAGTKTCQSPIPYAWRQQA